MAFPDFIMTPGGQPLIIDGIFILNAEDCCCHECCTVDDCCFFVNENILYSFDQTLRNTSSGVILTEQKINSVIVCATDTCGVWTALTTYKRYASGTLVETDDVILTVRYLGGGMWNEKCVKISDMSIIFDTNRTGDCAGYSYDNDATPSAPTSSREVGSGKIVTSPC